MLKIKFFLLSLLCLSNLRAYAEGFDGFSISGEIVHNSASGEFVNDKTYDADKDKSLSTLNVNYSFNLQKNFYIQLGANFDLNKIETHTHSVYYANPNTGDLGEVKTKIKEKNHFSIYIAPAYSISPNFLVYGKLAYHYLNSELKIKRPPQTDIVDIPPQFQNFSDPNKNLNDESSHHGIGLGLGIKYLLSDKFFTYSELQKIKFSKESYSLGREYEPESTRLSLGFGYIF